MARMPINLNIQKTRILQTFTFSQRAPITHYAICHFSQNVQYLSQISYKLYNNNYYYPIVKFGPDLGSGAVNNLEESEEEERNVPNTSSDAHCKKLDVIRNCSTENETPQTLNAECTTDAQDGPRRPDHVKPTSDDQLSLDEEPIYGNTLSDRDKPSPVRLEDFEAYAEKKKSDMNVFMAEYMVFLLLSNRPVCWPDVNINVLFMPS